MNKKIIVSLVALIIVGATALPIEAAAVPVSQPVSMQSAVVPISRVSKTAPTPATAKPENEGTVFEGYNVTVTDKNTPAVLSGGIDWPITKLYFFSANGDYLGSISGVAYKAIMDKYKVIGEGGSVDAPGSNGDWEYWFAEKFNAYRGISGGSENTQVYEKSSGTSKKEVDTAAYAEEVISLINQKREDIGLEALQTDSELTSHSEIRAEELSIQYSHVRPNGTKEKSECIVMRRDSPSTAVKAWMESDPHRDAILNESGRFPYQSIGAGCYQDEKGVLYWVITFSTDYDGGNSSNQSYSGGKDIARATYNLNATKLSLTAGEGYQLLVEPSAYVDNMQIEWVASKLSDGILSVDDDGYITTYHRSGMSSAKATLTVSAKIYASDKLVKTLNCKVIVTQ